MNNRLVSTGAHGLPDLEEEIDELQRKNKQLKIKVEELQKQATSPTIAANYAQQTITQASQSLHAVAKHDWSQAHLFARGAESVARQLAELIEKNKSSF